MPSKRAKAATVEIFKTAQPIYSDPDEVAEIIDRHFPEADPRKVLARAVNNLIIAKITEYNATDSSIDLMSRLHAIRSLVEDFKAGAQAQAYVSQAITRLTEDIGGG